MTSRVSEKGQVTIPKDLRSRFGIRPGEEVTFREEDGRIVLEKAPRPGRFDALYGILELDKSTDELIDEMRGPAELP
ncbi:MAG: AbrB/MazE/SpoVT family DNA-binding domain-containing protein [Actinomycetota bacterium]|nr:AbrB/MazE/SpoVT family DNA-binding domain-containing protein [Actinomycetota bacterium]